MTPDLTSTGTTGGVIVISSTPGGASYEWDRFQRAMEPIVDMAHRFKDRFKVLLEKHFRSPVVEEFVDLVAEMGPRATPTPPTHLPWPFNLRAFPMGDPLPPSQPGLAHTPTRYRACTRQSVPARTRRRIRVWERP